MNKVISLLFIFISLLFCSNATPENTYGMPLDDSGKITYEEIVDQEGIKDTLYNRAFAWARSYFVNVYTNVKNYSREDGLISGKNFVKTFTTDKKGKTMDAGAIMYDFSINIKDNKYKVTLTNFRKYDNSGNPLEPWFKDTDKKQVEIHTEIFKQIDENAKGFLASLKGSMKPGTAKKDEW